MMDDDGPPVPDPAATRAAVTLHGDTVYSIALTHTRCRADADDVYQEVFLTFHRKQPVCNDDEHRKAWLITTTLNCARRAATSSWRTRVVPLEPSTAEQILPASFEFVTDEQDAIFRAMSGLDEAYRTVLHLFYFDDQPVAAIANTLGLEVGAVKMRLSRGRRILRDQLQGGYFDER